MPRKTPQKYPVIKPQTTATIRLYDCTLRDGAQGPGINYSLRDKLRLAIALDEFGIDYIEAGWPGANPKDTALFEKLAQKPLKHACLVAFGATHKAGIKAKDDPGLQVLARCSAKVIAIVGKSSLQHVTDILGITPEENLKIIKDSIQYLVKEGKQVFFDAEHFFDGYRDNSTYAMKVLTTAHDAGANNIILCDTNGATLPYDIADTVQEVSRKLPQDITLGIHAHNDSDCAVGSSLAAIRTGCGIVQGTINGFGERCGNANLCSIIPAVAMKMPGYRINQSVKLQTLTQLSRLFYEVTVTRERPQQPYVGAYAFAHKAGMHVDAVAKSPRSFEQIPPEAVGNNREVLLSELSGTRSIAMKAKQFGMELDAKSPAVKSLLADLKRREAEGYAFEAADASFQLLIDQKLNKKKAPFELDGFRVIIEKRGPGEKCLSAATLKVRVNGRKSEINAAEGEGPVEALDICLRKSLATFFPEVRNMKLRDFKVRIIDGSAGTAAKTRVLIDSTDGKREWSTVGLSENIIEAAWQALQDSINYFIQGS
ncbi:MAG: citramalate synthase [Lentisphaeria bacterium]|nr:citramalate synthase [Lentisphaeria bacterium]